MQHARVPCGLRYGRLGGLGRVQRGVWHRIDDANAYRGYTRGPRRRGVRKHERDDPVQRFPVPDSGTDAFSNAFANGFANGCANGLANGGSKSSANSCPHGCADRSSYRSSHTCADVCSGGLRRGELVRLLGVFAALREWDDVAEPHFRGGAVRRHVPRRFECDV